VARLIDRSRPLVLHLSEIVCNRNHMIRRRQLLLMGAALATGPARAAIERVEAAVFSSPALERNLPYLVYPFGGPGPGAPVIYLLHGHGGSEWDWLRAGGAMAAVDALVGAGRLSPVHLVLPGVGNSWYVDGPPPHGPVASMLLDGLMPVVEEGLGADPTRRAIIGLSMGGFGALHLGLERPGRWRFLAGLSPAIFPPSTDFSESQLRLFAGAFGDPFEPERYAAADPFGRIARLSASMPQPAFYLSCGDEDSLGLDAGTEAFGAALREAGAQVNVAIKPGRHDWAFWRAELPLALAAFADSLV
jgi:enterochelin esterase family protein